MVAYYAMTLEFIELKSFTLTATGVLSDEELHAVEDELLENPDVGVLIAGTGGVRKIRAPMVGRGKRGGARVIYYYDRRRAVIHLILAYAKNQSSTLTAAGKKFVREIARDIDLA